MSTFHLEPGECFCPGQLAPASGIYTVAGPGLRREVVMVKGHRFPPYRASERGFNLRIAARRC